MKFWLFSSASLAACVALLVYTYMTRQQFYPSIIYLVTSKISLLVLGNAGLVLTALFGRLVKTLFLGPLRDAEVELLHENVRYAVTETCLALTVFRDEISFNVMVLFTALIFLKIFHWLSQSRIEFIEQSDVVSRLTHVRLVALMTILSVVDMAFVVWCSISLLDEGPSVFILFGFEFLILTITIAATILRYLLHIVDSRMDGAWTNKFTYLFYLELVSEITKLVVYLVFFTLIFTLFGMPLHIVRDLWLSIKNLQRRIASYYRYRKITSNLNDRFANPTAEELEETDKTCIICREEMTPSTCKKLPCSHIFHINCLKMWIQRQQTCPTCRSSIPTGPAPRTGPNNNASAGVPAQGANAPEQQAPRFRWNAAFRRVVPPRSQPTVLTAAQVATNEPPAAAAPFGLGYPNPYMPPMMFAPGMAAPFGYGMPGTYGMMPPFGAPPMDLLGQQQPGMDSESIQRQIDLLQAQLAVLQASTAQFDVSHQNVATSLPHAPTPIGSVIPTEAVSLSTQRSPLSSGSLSAAHAAVHSVVNGAATTTTPIPEELEEKCRIPSTSQRGESATSTANVELTPIESKIPAAPQTESERRREELRQRYSRIYGSASKSSDNNEKTND
ncbi:hypothetical protein CCR75_001793 [Bremia lactucae]|uniref:RING-type E3 ubiquitin transferase n=1 Tax=Bremia lactucae TaxID=4779 RepID=A0A976IH93_BRELC|nr:hypothetical protein CCR75_001793 [Bremia lactucae]